MEDVPDSGLQRCGLLHVPPFPTKGAEPIHDLIVRYLEQNFDDTDKSLCKVKELHVRSTSSTKPIPDGNWFLNLLPCRRAMFPDGDDIVEVAVFAELASIPDLSFPVMVKIPGAGLRLVARGRWVDCETIDGGVIAATLVTLKRPSVRADIDATVLSLPWIPKIDLGLSMEPAQDGQVAPEHVELVADPTPRRKPDGSPADLLPVKAELYFQLPPHPAETHAPAADGSDEPEPLGPLYRVDVAAEEGFPVERVTLLAANCAPPNATLLDEDPASRAGNPDLRASAKERAILAWAAEKPLAGLKQPTSGLQRLDGQFVVLQSPNLLNVGPPEQPVGTDFDFDPRTDEFAAANAYHHCDCAFRLAASLNMTAGNYFHGRQFPVTVVHRAPMEAFNRVVIPAVPNGIVIDLPYNDRAVFTVNAQVLQGFAPPDRRGATAKVAQIRFALGDLSDAKALPVLTPGTGNKGALGAAADPRWAWHEFGHAVALAGTGRLELTFAHSPGDAIAAIQSDPTSRFAEDAFNRNGSSLRGVTFPWLRDPLRRHDRSPKDGWSWWGALGDARLGHYPPALDPNGYWGEQVLSSSLFRFYRAIGGDAKDAATGLADVAARRFAADHATFLILRGVGHLGPLKTGPEDLVNGMIASDAATPLFARSGRSRAGGALRKVIRWAFEMQGLYGPPKEEGRWNDVGLAEAVDLYIEDGRAGHYHHAAGWEVLPTAIRVAPAGKSGDVSPVAGAATRIRVKVWNRGSDPTRSTALTVRAWVYAGTAPATHFPTGWTALPPVVLGPAAYPVNAPTALPVIAWTPGAGTHHGVLVALGCADDASLLDPGSLLDTATKPVPLADFVPFDNNLGLRRWPAA